MHQAYHPIKRKTYNPDTASNRYRSIISRFLHKRKMPAIPPILADGKLVSDFLG